MNGEEWTAVLGEILTNEWKIGNIVNRYAVTINKYFGETVGHVPKKKNISRICSVFLEQDMTITAFINQVGLVSWKISSQPNPTQPNPTQPNPTQTRGEGIPQQQAGTRAPHQMCHNSRDPELPPYLTFSLLKVLMEMKATGYRKSNCVSQLTSNKQHSCIMYISTNFMNSL